VSSSARIRLLSKPGCHLCDDARAVVEAVAAETGETVEEVDITTDPALHSQWADEIPVVFVDGRQHAFWRVDAERLRHALHSG
jgi:glutaredoxin